MAEWLWTLDLSHEWPSIEQGGVSLQQSCMLIAGKLAALPPSTREAPSARLAELTQTWVRASVNPPTRVDEFDDLLRGLYDWGDEKITPHLNTCWIRTSHG